MQAVSLNGRDYFHPSIGNMPADPLQPREGKCRRKEGEKSLSRRDRSPCPRLTPPSLLWGVSIRSLPNSGISWVNVPSSFASSAGAASSPAAAAPPAPPAGAAAAPPPEPTFRRRSLTSLPSRACSLIRNCVQCLSVFERAHLGEKGCPDGLDFLDLCGLDERLELVGLVKSVTVLASAPQNSYSDIDTVIGEDESGVGGGKLGGRHCDVRGS